MYLRIEIFRAGEFIPRHVLQPVAHAHIHDARLYASADCLVAINGVVVGVEAVAEDENVRPTPVLHGLVKLHGDISAVGAERHKVVLRQRHLRVLAHFLLCRLLVGFGQHIDELPRCLMEFHHLVAKALGADCPSAKEECREYRDCRFHCRLVFQGVIQTIPRRRYRRSR